jgi:hypothetical protein
MLNVYTKFDKPRTLSLYNKLSDKLHLIGTSRTWTPDMVEELVPVKTVIVKQPGAAYNYAFRVLRGRFPEGEAAISRVADLAYDYAWTILSNDPEWVKIKGHEHGRWPEAEDTIKMDPHSASFYAEYVIKGRWEEAEPYIMKRVDIAVDYAIDVLKCRWKDVGHPEAEQAIMKDPDSAFRYARRIIKGRWPEAEPYIKTDKDYWDDYRRTFKVKE